MPVEKKCLVCSKEFFTLESRTRAGNGKFCSRGCSSSNQRQGKMVICKTCGESFYAKKHSVKNGHGKFCKASCYFLSQEVKIGGLQSSGKQKSEETRKKISLAKKGKPRTPSDKYGMGEEARKRLSESRSGDKCHWWKGGLTKLTGLTYHNFRYSAWRKAVFERDDFTCVFCGSRGAYLEADHIRPRSIIVREFLKKRPDLNTVGEKLAALLEHEELWDESNGRTLCKPCHKTTDTYGLKALTPKK